MYTIYTICIPYIIICIAHFLLESQVKMRHPPFMFNCFWNFFGPCFPHFYNLLFFLEASSIFIQLHTFCFFEPVCEAMESWKFNFPPKLITLLEQGGGWIEVRLVGAIEMFIADLYLLMYTGYMQDIHGIQFHKSPFLCHSPPSGGG